MKGSEQILTAMSGIGEDLVIMAEQQRFPRSMWQQVLPVAACLLLIIGGAAGLKKLPVQPVYTEPPVEVETPPAEVEAPPEAVQPPEEIVIPEEPLEEPAEIPCYAKALNTPAFYVFDTDTTTAMKPSKAIAPDGTVLLSVERGKIEPLIDQATGEYMAILVYHRSDGQTIRETSYDIYNLEGKNVAAGLQAYDVDCLGNVVMMLSQENDKNIVSLYWRDTYALLQTYVGYGIIVGDCIWLEVPDGDTLTHYLVDRSGDVTEMTDPMDTYFLWEGHPYFVVQQEDGTVGLRDAWGVSLLPRTFDRIVYGISNGYVICEDDNGAYLMEIETGECAFHWPRTILAAYPEHVLVQLEDFRYALVDWDGNILAEGSTILDYDDNKDGKPELFLCRNDDGTVYMRPDGSVLATASMPDRVWSSVLLNSRTLLNLNVETGELEIRNLITGEAVLLEDHVYSTFTAIHEEGQTTGLFYAAYEQEGEMRCSVIREDGTVLLEGISDMWTRQGDAFYTEQDGMAGLIRMDGTWIYQEPLE